MKKRPVILALLTAVLAAGISPSDVKAGSITAEPEVVPLTVNVQSLYDSRDVSDTHWVYYVVPSIELDSEGYPELSAALEQYNDEQLAFGKAILDEYAVSMENDLEYLEDYADYFTECADSVYRADSCILSFLETQSAYAGGAHPNTWYITHTYDSRSGQELLLTDVLQDPDSLPEILEAALLETRDPEDFFDSDLAGVIREEMNPEGTWINDLTGEETPAVPGPSFTLGYDNITFWFSPYELASYAYGGFHQTLYFSDYPDLVKPEYQRAASSRILPVPQDTEIPLPGTGKTMSWQAVSTDEYGMEFDLSVTSGNASYTDHVYAFSFDGWLLQRDDRSFFILESSMEDDYRNLTIFDLNISDDDTQFPEPQVIGRHFDSESPVNPDNVILAGRTDMLSTFSVKRPYRFDENGTPVPLEPWDTIIDWSNDDFEMALTAKTELEADISDPETGEITGTTTIPAGEKLHFVRTDCVTWVDLRMEDGTLVRIYTSDEWPQKANGIDAEEVFDGIMYAG